MGRGFAIVVWSFCSEPRCVMTVCGLILWIVPSLYCISCPIWRQQVYGACGEAQIMFDVGDQSLAPSSLVGIWYTWWQQSSFLPSRDGTIHRMRPHTVITHRGSEQKDHTTIAKPLPTACYQNKDSVLCTILRLHIMKAYKKCPNIIQCTCSLALYIITDRVSTSQSNHVNFQDTFF